MVGRGVLVVKLWWIAGESWEVDGQDSGSKNMPLFPDLFLRDSHFGNLAQPHPPRLGERLRAPTSTSTASSPAGQGSHQHEGHLQGRQGLRISLVDETSELMVISQFGKIIRIDTKSIRAAGRSTPGRQDPRPSKPRTM